MTAPDLNRNEHFGLLNSNEFQQRKTIIFNKSQHLPGKLINIQQHQNIVNTKNKRVAKEENTFVMS